MDNHGHVGKGSIRQRVTELTMAAAAAAAAAAADPAVVLTHPRLQYRSE